MRSATTSTSWSIATPGRRRGWDCVSQQALEPYGLYFFEEPCWPETIEDIALIQRAVRTPIATGERLVSQHAFRELFEKRACSVLQPDITHCGGLTEARRIAAMAEAYRVALAPHNPQGPVSTAASLEFGFATPSYIICESVHPDVPWRQDVVQRRVHGGEEGPDRAAEQPARFGHQRSTRRRSRSIRSSRKSCSGAFTPTARSEIGEERATDEAQEKLWRLLTGSCALFIFNVQVACLMASGPLP